MRKKYFVYILCCSDHSLYTGYTVDLQKRLRVHNEGKGAKYTRSRLPVECVYFEQFHEKSAAQKREYEIKKLTREQKLHLISTTSKGGI